MATTTIISSSPFSHHQQQRRQEQEQQCAQRRCKICLAVAIFFFSFVLFHYSFFDQISSYRGNSKYMINNDVHIERKYINVRDVTENNSNSKLELEIEETSIIRNNNNNNNTSSSSRTSILFEPGGIKNITNKVETFRQCMVDPIKYKNHIRRFHIFNIAAYPNTSSSSSSLLSSYSHLLYVHHVKVGSTTSRSTMKKDPFYSVEGLCCNRRTKSKTSQFVMKEKINHKPLASKFVINTNKHGSNDSNNNNNNEKNIYHAFTFSRDPMRRFISSFQEAMRRKLFYKKKSQFLPLKQLREQYLTKQKKPQPELDHEFMVKALELFVDNYNGGFVVVGNDRQGGREEEEDERLAENHFRLQTIELVSRNTPLELRQFKSKDIDVNTNNDYDNLSSNNKEKYKTIYMPPHFIDSINDINSIEDVFNQFIKDAATTTAANTATTEKNKNNNNNRRRNLSESNIDQQQQKQKRKQKQQNRQQQPHLNINTDINNMKGSDVNETTNTLLTAKVESKNTKKLRILPDDLNIKTRQKICQLTAIDYCCLNYKLPKLCHGLVICKLNKLEVVEVEAMNKNIQKNDYSWGHTEDKNEQQQKQIKWVIETIVKEKLDKEEVGEIK